MASVLLGAVHAFAPGHGKTVMAAYLVGQRGSFRQAMAVALTVTATHTAGVLALGMAISTSAVVAPERVYPWLGAASGVLLALLGLAFLRRIVVPGPYSPSPDTSPTTTPPTTTPPTTTLLATTPPAITPPTPTPPTPPRTCRPRSCSRSRWPRPHPRAVGARPDRHPEGTAGDGLRGGLLPSPSAVVVLLGAVALGRTWFGVLLVVAYGLGMAAALAATGLVLLRARAAVDRRLTGLRANRLLQAGTRLLPPATAVFIVTAGIYLTARAAAQL